MPIREKFPKAQLPRSHYFFSIGRGDSLRTFALRPLTLWAIIALLPLSLLWGGGATLYLAFHDDMLGIYLTHQIEMRNAYEDRIAEARAELDRVASRQLLDQQFLRGQSSRSAFAAGAAGTTRLDRGLPRDTSRGARSGHDRGNSTPSRRGQGSGSGVERDRGGEQDGAVRQRHRPRHARLRAIADRNRAPRGAKTTTGRGAARPRERHSEGGGRARLRRSRRRGEQSRSRRFGAARPDRLFARSRRARATRDARPGRDGRAGRRRASQRGGRQDRPLHG